MALLCLLLSAFLLRLCSCILHATFELECIPLNLFAFILVFVLESRCIKKGICNKCCSVIKAGCSAALDLVPPFSDSLITD